MYARLLDFLCCPDCRGGLELTTLASEQTPGGEEVTEGLLGCARGHWFPVVRGIPRMLPDALERHWGDIEPRLRREASYDEVRRSLDEFRHGGKAASYHRATQENFSHEWDNHELGGKTWGMELSDRVRWYFLEPLRLPAAELAGKVMLDAGCGNGSQSVAYTAYGLEVLAVDLSTGLEHGHAYRRLHKGADPARVHFIQGNLQQPPIRDGAVDIIHSAGVLHHTPDTLRTFRALRPLLRPGGTFYVWLYKYEKLVTPVVNSIRAVTTRIPPAGFARVAQLMATPFIGFCRAVNALGVRAYPKLDRREAALALMDIFGAPYAHYHSFDEVAGWYKAAGFTEVWPCNDGRRGFGVCGRLGAPAREATGQPRSQAGPQAQAAPGLQGGSA